MAVAYSIYTPTYEFTQTTDTKPIQQYSPNFQELAKLFESKRMYERDGKEIIVTVSMDGTVHVDPEAFEMLLKEVGFERTE